MTKAEILTVFAQMKTAFPDAVVTCTNGGSSAAGIRSTRRGDGELQEKGQMGPETGYVNVPADDIGEVTMGSTITIDGEESEVTNAAVDNAGALTHIDFLVRRKFTGDVE